MVGWRCRTIPSQIDPTDAFTRRYSWRFEGHAFEWDLALPRAYYDLHQRRHRVYAYGAYVADEFTQRIVAGLCDSIERRADALDLDRLGRVRFAAAFVQHLPYTPDDVSTQYSNYPRYPVETLVDETGDCEDTSLLLAALLHGLGFQVGLVEFPTHLGVGIIEPSLPTSFVFGDTEVTYLEATATGWDPGTVPPKYADERPSLHGVADAPSLYVGWRGEQHGSTAALAGTLTNLGAGTAEDVRVSLEFLGSDGRPVDGIVERFPTVPTEADPTWRGRVDLRGARRVRPEWHAAIGGTVHDCGSGEPAEVPA